jgi:transcriptional regulator with XRE-family HTH domain
VEDFAGLLRRLRESRGWTMYRLAKLSGLTGEGISKLEEAGSDPRLSTLFKLATAFGVELSELLPEAAPGGRGGARGKQTRQDARNRKGKPKK